MHKWLVATGRGFRLNFGIKKVSLPYTFLVQSVNNSLFLSNFAFNY